jgi:hypothetical protein
MICLNCKKQIADTSISCPNCGAPVNPIVQIPHEIKLRRWQRWFFYGVFIAMFLGAIAFAIKVYSDNTALLQASIDLKTSLQTTQGDLATAKSSVASKDNELQQAQGQLTQLQQQLNVKTADLQSVTQQKELVMSEYDSVKAVLSSVNANTFNAIVQMGVGASFADLVKIPVADYNLGAGNDADGDGLSDLVETALGTDKNKADTDGDGFNDKLEVIGGFNPLVKGKSYPLDLKYANSQKGKILLSVQGNNEAWYVNPKDGKRYFLGNPAEAVKALIGQQKAVSPTPVAPVSTSTSIK